MKAKTIEKVLTTKIEDWISTIKDDEIANRARNGAIVTGGCIASMLLKEPVNDFDVYFKDAKTAKAVASYYIKEFIKDTDPSVTIELCDDEERARIKVSSIGVAGLEENDESDEIESYAETENTGSVEEALSGKYRPVFVTENAITLTNKVQLVFRFSGNADEIHKNYDFVHCTNYWESGTGKLTLRQPALEALIARELRYVGSKYPICSVMRLRKFIKRGWTINAGQILKMAIQIGELDLTDPSVLRDQLTGVDMAYFSELIGLIKEKDLSGEKVNSTYIYEIVDRIF